MKKSEKNMLIAFLVLLGVFGVVPAIWSGLRDPIDKAEAQLSGAESRKEKAELAFDAAMQQITKMKAFKARSLSSNPSQGAHAYQQWLSDLTEVVAKFDDPEVTPDRISTSRDNSYVTIRVRVSGEGSLEQLREFLYRFHRANVLHRVATLSVDAVDNTSRPLLKIDMTIEALSLPTAPEKASTTLFPRTELLSDGKNGELEVIHINMFTETPFEARVGDKFVSVNERSKQFWDIEGVIPTFAAGEMISLVIPADDTKEKKAAASSPAPAAKNQPTDVEVELLEAIKDGATYVTVKATDEFPKAPFEVKIGEKVLKVTQRTELWAVDDQSFRASKGTTVEISPVHPDFVESTLEDFDTLIRKNPFAKPIPLRPTLDLIGEKIVKRGSSTMLLPRASGYDDRPGKAIVELTSGLVEGMTFEEGKLRWNPPQDMKAGNFEVSFKASAPGLAKPLERTFEVSLIDANDPPEIDLPKDVVATIGQSVTLQLLASDKETPDDLTYSFGEGAPEGAVLDGRTGIFTWTPASTSQPGDVSIPIKVTDVGTPQQTTAVSLMIKIQDDVAQFTFLTAFVSTEADRQAWLYDRSTNKRIVLRKGGTLAYAGFNALVLSVGREFVDIQQNNEIWRIEAGKSLRQAQMIAKLEPKEEPKPESPKADEPKDDPRPEAPPEPEKTVTPATEVKPDIVDAPVSIPTEKSEEK
jgi:hypothetical protein